MKEQRRSDRRSTLLDAELHEYLDGRVCTLPVRDCSPRGVFLATTKLSAFHLGEIVTLRVRMPGREERLVATGEVVRIVNRKTAKEHHGEAGLGIEFVEEQPALAR